MKNGYAILTALIALNSVAIAQIDDGLVAHYDFTDGNVTDASGNGKDGVANNTTLASDRFGNEDHALTFNGIDSYVKMPDTLLTQDSMTVSLWFKSTKGGGLLGHQGGEVMTSASQRVPLAYIGQDSAMYGGFWTGSVITVNQDQEKGKYNDGQWHHLVMTVGKGRGQKFYLDNQLQGEHNSYSFLSGMVNNQIGMALAPNWPQSNGAWYGWDGQIDDVRVYHKMVSADIVDSLFNQPNPVAPLPVPQLEVCLIANYDFNNQTANDGTGNENHGVGHDLTPAMDRFGNEGNAFNFNGTSSYVEMPEGLLIQDSVSVSLWFKSNGARDGALLGHQDNGVGLASSQRVPLAYIGMDNLLYGGYWTGTVLSVHDNETQYNDGEWHHLVMTVGKDQGQEIYVDNKLTGTHNNYSYLPNMVKNQIGAAYAPGWPQSNGGWFYFDGDIDDIWVYDRKLNAGDVDSLYNMPDPGPVVSTKSIEVADVAVYPNPSTGVLTLVGNNIQNVQVLDNSGRLVWRGAANNTIDLSALNAGLYHLRIATSNGVIHKKQLIK